MAKVTARGGKPGGAGGRGKPRPAAAGSPAKVAGGRGGKPRGGAGGRGRGSFRGGRGAAAGGGRQDAKRKAGEEAVDDDGPANKKRALKRQRQAQRPEFDTVTRGKEIWNRMRERKVPAEERRRLVDELVGIVRGKVYQISMKHDASRIIQCAVQYGGDDDRAAIVGELEGHLVELSQLLYAHFIVIKLLTYVKRPADRKRVVKDLRGHIVRLATHAVGARVVETALRVLPASSISGFRAEFYGAEFALFDDAAQPQGLAAALKARPDRRTQLLAHVGGLVTRLTEKALFGFDYAQRLLWEYLQEIGPAACRELVPQLLEAYTALLQTRDGCRAAAMCAAWGTAKDRKRMMRALKGHVANALMHSHAYLAVLRLVESVDDTVTCQKMVLAELLQPAPAQRPGMGGSAESWVPKGLARAKGGADEEDDGSAAAAAAAAAAAKAKKAAEHVAEEEEEAEVAEEAAEEEEEGGEEAEDDGEGEEPEAAAASEGEEDEEEVEDSAAPLALLPVARHKNGCKLLLCLLTPDHKHYLDPSELEILAPVAVPDPAGGKDVPTSRKDPEVRRRELLGFLKLPLVEICRKNTEILMRSKCAGSSVLLEVMGALRTPELVSAAADVATNEVEKDDENALPAMWEDPAGHLFMKRLLIREGEEQRKRAADGGGSSSGGKEEEDEAPWFSDELLKRIVVSDSVLPWLSCNRGAFVLASLLGVPSAAEQAARQLRPHAAKIQELAAESQGAKVLAEQLAKLPAAPAAAAAASKKKPVKAKAEAAGSKRSSSMKNSA